MKPDKELLTAKECAKYIGISTSYFYKLRKRYPDLPYRSFGKDDPRYYYGQEVLEFLLDQGGNVR